MWADFFREAGNGILPRGREQNPETIPGTTGEPVGFHSQRNEKGAVKFFVNKKFVIGVGVFTAILFLTFLVFYPKIYVREPINVGILHSLTGTMAVSEKAVVDAIVLAIDEVNTKGGILGRKIKPIIADGCSDWVMFAREAERLVVKEKVSVVFGCWTSVSRKAVKPIFEKYNNLLIYPVPYEGLEQSPNIVYMGAVPNQQVIPTLKWCFDQGLRRFFLVGSDYVFSRAVNEIIKTQVAAFGGEVVGEEYLFLGSKNARQAVEEIIKAGPDIILNTINGDTNIAFFTELRRQGIMPEDVPTLSFSMAEEEISEMGPQLVAGDYAAWSYFQSVDSKKNNAFVRAFKKRYGKDRVIDDPMEAGYCGVYLWAQAVKDAGTDDAGVVRKAIGNQSFTAPQGVIYVDPDTLHTWKTARIGRINEDGQFHIVWTSGRPIRPARYPAYKTKADWEKFLDDLYNEWGQNWAAPGS